MQVFGGPELGERLHHLAALVLAHETVVDMEQMELFGTESPREEPGADRRVHTARSQQEYTAFAGQVLDFGQLLVDVSRHRP